MFVAAAGDNLVIGLYSLSIRPLVPTKGLRFHLAHIPAIYFDNLGVTQSAQGMGVAAQLMVDAFIRTMQVSEHVGVHCLWLTATDARTCQFYRKLGFVETQPRERNNFDMFIPRTMIEDALSA